MKTYRYDTLFVYGSLQSVGHTTEYFVRHTRKLVVFIIMPRVNRMSNILRIYKEGRLELEREILSSSHLGLYYFLWWYFQIIILFRYFNRRERVILLSGHPIAFFGMSIVKLFRHVIYAYWIGDYFPPVHWSLFLFEKLKKYYHDNVSYTYYLSDRLNAIYNGRVVSEPGKRTVMWGVKPFTGAHTAPGKQYRLLFVGVIRPSQGIEDILLFLKRSPNVYLSILGSCEQALYKEYTHLIRSYGIADRVWFPNTFIDDQKLREIAKTHHVGIALYEKGLHTATHYTDPGKIKTYIELGLPVVMTDTSAIADILKRFDAGKVLSDVKDLPKALEDIRKRYVQYQKGVRVFADFFRYDAYYRSAFESLESRT